LRNRSRESRRAARWWGWFAAADVAVALLLLTGCGTTGSPAAAGQGPTVRSTGALAAAAAPGGSWCTAAQDLVHAHSALLLRAMQEEDVSAQKQQAAQARDELRRATPVQLRPDVETYARYETQIEDAMIDMADEAPTSPPGYAVVVDHIVTYSRSQGCVVSIDLGTATP
jgi:hypothetical protein